MKPSKHPPSNNILYLKSSQPQKKNEVEVLKKEISKLTKRLNQLEKKYSQTPSNKKNLTSQTSNLAAPLSNFKKTPKTRFPAKGLLKYLPFIPERSILSEEIDPFGRDPQFENKLKPFFDFLYYRYWRVSTHGVENLPSEGRGLLVSNHSGTLPWDGSMIRVAVTNDHPAERDVRFLVEDFVYYLPFVGTWMYRIGGVRASQENAERLLNNDHLVAVFPEGVKGIGKYYSQRYHLQRFGRGGFIKLAIRTKSPIIPVAVIGAEEIHPLLYKSSFLAKPLGIPYLPVTPTLPLLGPLGLIPYPSKWSIYFGKPIDLSHYDESILDEELEVHKLSEMVRQTIQSMVTEGLKKRGSVWWG
jgi:1-acyl-sn-glycerol-3-phosphate acyltransferase